MTLLSDTLDDLTKHLTGSIVSNCLEVLQEVQHREELPFSKLVY